MTKTEAKRFIKSRAWALVLCYDDGELGAVDATTEIACRLMTKVPEACVGIYRPEQSEYLLTDLRRQGRRVNGERMRMAA